MSRPGIPRTANPFGALPLRESELSPVAATGPAWSGWYPGAEGTGVPTWDRCAEHVDRLGRAACQLSEGRIHRECDRYRHKISAFVRVAPEKNGGRCQLMKSEESCADMPIESLSASEQCIDALKQSGFTTVGELVEFLEGTWGGRAGSVALAPRALKYLDEIVNRLKAIGCWPDTLA